MKPVLILALTVLTLASCKPQKPWSPYDNDGGGATESKDTAPITSKSLDDRYNADIGDIEQAVYVSGAIADDSKGPNVQMKNVMDQNKHIAISNITLTPPYPKSLWAEYVLKCNRNFMSAPAILRARVSVDGKDAGSFSVVLGTKAKNNGLSIKVDLLKPFEGNLPKSFLAKIDGDFYLMPDGTDEDKVNAESATSDIHSKALGATMFRINCSEAPASDTVAIPGPPPGDEADDQTNDSAAAAPEPAPAPAAQ